MKLLRVKYSIFWQQHQFLYTFLYTLSHFHHFQLDFYQVWNHQDSKRNEGQVWSYHSSTYSFTRQAAYWQLFKLPCTAVFKHDRWFTIAVWQYSAFLAQAFTVPSEFILNTPIGLTSYTAFIFRTLKCLPQVSSSIARSEAIKLVDLATNPAFWNLVAFGWEVLLIPRIWCLVVDWLKDWCFDDLHS